MRASRVVIAVREEWKRACNRERSEQAGALQISFDRRKLVYRISGLFRSLAITSALPFLPQAITTLDARINPLDVFLD